MTAQPSSAQEATRTPAAPAVRGMAAAPPARGAEGGRSALARRAALGLQGQAWLRRASWSVGRTGRPGLVGLALLGAAGVFLASTHLEVKGEVAALRAAVATARARGLTGAGEGGAPEPADPGAALRALPLRNDLPAQLRTLFEGAARARLSIDTARYEVSLLRTSGVAKYQVTFPVTGPYPQIRAFVDATLDALPSAALSELAIERRSIGDADVEARLRWTLFMRSEP